MVSWVGVATCVVPKGTVWSSGMMVSDVPVVKTMQSPLVSGEVHSVRVLGSHANEATNLRVVLQPI